ncbi:MAG TPA: beta-galactosidase GalB [Chitinophagaceae bacterium]|nr:beta-galactosidase GalB [Chitinophagaceae bacterium]
MRWYRIASMFLFCVLVFSNALVYAQTGSQNTVGFNQQWKFFLGDAPAAADAGFDDAAWRSVQLPHDWSIELPFDSTSPTGTGGGALRGGLAWYRKTFTLPASANGKNVFIDFDGVYCNSEVFINGHSLGVRPNGFISFRYDLTPYLKYNQQKNVIAVKVDNSQQPNARWYSGSGIYRNVWLVTVNKVFVDHWGTQVSTPQVSAAAATVHINTMVRSSSASAGKAAVKTSLYNERQQVVATKTSNIQLGSNSVASLAQQFTVATPALWSVDHPQLYKAVTEIIVNNTVVDTYHTVFGIRYFNFDAAKGFSLNGKPLKIMGVCNHHDLGCLGAAINTRALERQLQILKAMGCNGIRTSHNPPAPELLDLCDKMGFIVMDEAFDMWKKQKNKYDYHLNWDEWHKQDLQDQVLRDRNHPSVMIWSIGNEIQEQWSGKDGKDSSGTVIARELAAIVKALDTTRPITSALNSPYPNNAIYASGALDLVGFNYHHQDFASFPQKFAGQKFIGTETVSALQTRGHYDMPSDSIRRWPSRWDKPVENANADLTCSAYDNCSAPWGSTHEETLKELLAHEFASGMFVWTGFDYLGEPTPYPWPARSSYFGIIDLAGFPKDVYYLYKSIFTDKPVLHVFPHWNWQPGQMVDLWAYYNQADEAELFINGQSMGTKKKTGNELHVMWRVPFTPGTVQVISRKNGKQVLQQTIHTAGPAARLQLTADRQLLQASGNDLSFITVKVMDKDGNLLPNADNLVNFTVRGNGAIAGVDNGSPVSMESFKASKRKAFNGMCLAVIQTNGKPGSISVTASAEGLAPASVQLSVR